MTALHQAAQKAVEALKAAQRAINSMKVEAETAAAGGDEQMLQDACETISAEGLEADTELRAAIADLSALQQQPEPVAHHPEIDRDSDGELLIDWAPGEGRMLSMTLRDDGRLSYAFRWDGETAHGQAQMPPALQQQEVPREPVALADAAWVQRLRETAKHLRENSLSLAKYPGMSDEARARELAALYIGEIAELFEAKRAAASPSTTQQHEAARLSDFVNAARINASDMPLAVVQKLQAAIDAAPSTAREEAGVQKAQDPYGY